MIGIVIRRSVYFMIGIVIRSVWLRNDSYSSEHDKLLSLLYGLHSPEGNGDSVKRTRDQVKLGSYALSKSFSHVSHRYQVQSFIHNHLYLLVMLCHYPAAA